MADLLKDPMADNRKSFLATSSQDLKERGWNWVDIVLVSGDAYVDHPSFGIALIGRVLANEGYRVAILAQPRYDSPHDFKRFGRPRLFFGISAGNLDSIVSNYTGNAKVRDEDQYSPGGDPYFPGPRLKTNRRRPDRATAIYVNLAKQAYKEVATIIGGVEASLRRFCHYDYQQQKIRASVLTDSKADLLVYGMGERAVIEVARRLSHQEDLLGIAGTCVRLSPQEFAGRDFGQEQLLLPSFQDIGRDRQKFMAAELLVDQEARAAGQKILVQQQQSHYVVQMPAAPPLTSPELDAVYALPFTRQAPAESGHVPALEMIRNSITIVRGCCGNCSFCAITRHQGPALVSRSLESVVAEVARVAAARDFNGTISDLGGPTANLFGVSCRKGGCKKRECLFPKICPQLVIDEEIFLDLLRQVGKVKGVKHLFISSGLRMELLLQTPKLLRALLNKHCPGMLKIAPEHTVDKVLALMHKPGNHILQDFLAACGQIKREKGSRIALSAYLISAHPGCTLADMNQLAEDLKGLKLPVRQFQDFTPTPGTLATAMYVSELDRNGAPLYVAKNFRERQLQRECLQKNLASPLRPGKGKGRVKSSQGRKPGSPKGR
ncbi:MAG: YgiQ family radical SAM protein [Desulfurivibrionaceae bacterium]|nr:YgiQ family radical SAM protein [Desulfurivibrionaceae bacterium]